MRRRWSSEQSRSPHTQTRADVGTSPATGRAWGKDEITPQTSYPPFYHELLPVYIVVMRCPAQPCGGAPQQRTKKAPDSTTRPNRHRTHTHSPKRLAHPRSPINPLSTLTSRATHAHPLHPTSPRSTGFCAIWVCVSSSST